ncbi:four-carbon acid sugar kinase family protein [Rhabdochromatium marinum]|uniref:four-carbon acid sugar kinase family protein n=1 Tax=Rhabdochromatium marinum TaxID=48729 RepID=UPI001907E944|nr:four-carbon acid sugar kinase family protein [Rhabdochromatium marinum]MBK1647879.1 Hrp-dependent type III effector protein [Rhabdochromatium marinum]
MTSAVTKIIVIDDDPTGSQTVHSCLLLTRWDVETLLTGLRDAAPLFFILSNTRGMGAEQAAAVTREICRQLRTALEQLAAQGLRIQPLVVSRSDSTLRGHYPVETDVIAEELGPFDAHFLVPAFFEGGRITRDGIHYLRVDGQLVPVHETEFARDSVFGFSTAYLPDYVAEKTQGRIPAGQVVQLGLAAIQGDLSAQLRALHGNQCVVVDAEQPSDLDRFCTQVLAATAAGQRFLFRSAASLLTALAKLPPQPVAAADMGQFARNGQPGVVLMGSHVEKSSRQLERLIAAGRAEPGVLPLEIAIDRIDTEGEALLEQLQQQVRAVIRTGQGVVLYTSRGERQFPTREARLAFGERVAAFLVRIVQTLPEDIGFLISKGGITSNDTLSQGLALRTARVLGQILPGCSVVRCPAEHPRFPGLPVVIFPGNVGDDDALALAYHRLSSPAHAQNS